MELGPIQKRWVDTLRAHPERQYKEALGFKQGGMERYCCLGQALMILAEEGLAHPTFTSEGTLFDGATPIVLSDESFEALGLHDNEGTVSTNETPDETLAHFNDHCYTWPEIADFIENNPEKVFTKSV